MTARSGASLAIALASCLALAGFIAMTATVVALWGDGLHERGLLYLLGFAALMPLAAWQGAHRARALEQVLGPDATEVVAWLGAGLLLAALCLARLWAIELNAVAAVLAVLLAVSIWVGTAGRLWCRLSSRAVSQLARHRATVATAVAAIALGALYSFPVGVANEVVVAGVLVLAPVVLWGIRAAGRRRMSAPVSAAIDLAVLLALLLLVPALDLHARAGGAPGLTGLAVEEHMNYYLGPVNDVLHGRMVLVDTSSQYGVLPIYLLALWGKLAPLGYGAVGLLNGILFSLYFGCIYLILRLGRAPQILAASVLAVALVSSLFIVNGVDVSDLPQGGPLRHYLPLAIVCAWTAAARWPRLAPAAGAIAIAIVACSSIWSLELFAYSLFTLAALELFGARVLESPAESLSRRLTRRALVLAAAVGLAQLGYAVAVLLAAGELPDWRLYLAYFGTYSFGDYSSDTAALQPWALCLPIGFLYAGSAIALLILTARRHALLGRYPEAFTGLAGATAFGIADLTHLVPHFGSYVALSLSAPAFLVAGIWLWMAIDNWAVLAPRTRRLAWLACTWVCALLIAARWGGLAERLSYTPISYLAPGGDSLGAAVSRAWRSAPLDHRAAEGRRLVERHMADERDVLILTVPDLATAILLESRRADMLPLGHPVQSTLIADRIVGRLADSIAEIPAGTRMLTQRQLLRRPSPRDPLDQALGVFYFSRLAPIQEWALREIRRRFGLCTVASSRYGLTVVELRPRQGPSRRKGPGGSVRRASRHSAADRTRCQAPVSASTRTALP